jgi:capsular exopolysaccharide synthesis family protein
MVDGRLADDGSTHEASTEGEAPARRRLRPARHLLDRLSTLREHWLAVLVVFCVVFGLLMFSGLRSNATFEATATLTIESYAGSGNILMDLAALGKPSKVETEMEVLRSFRVARGAAEHVLGLEPHLGGVPKGRADVTGNEDTVPPRFGTLTSEVNAYRPWEALLRTFGIGEAPRPIEVKTTALPGGHYKETYRFRFDADGRALEVSGTVDGQEGSERLAAVTWGEPFTARGHTFVIEKPPGSLAGRVYDVVVESVDHVAHRIFTGITVNPVGRWTDVIEIVYAAGTPHHARAGATALAQSYIALRQLRKQGEFKTNEGWLREEISSLELALEPEEAELKQFISEKKAVLLSEQATAILERQSQLRLKKGDLARERSQEQYRLSQLEGGKAKSFEERVVLLGPDGANPMSTTLFQRYADLNREKAALQREGYTDENPKVQLKVAEIEATKKELEAILTLALDEKVRDQARLIAILEEQANEVESDLETLAGELEALPAIERELAALQGKVDTKQALLQRYREKLLELKSARTSSDVAARIVDEARLPPSRSSPSLLRTGLLALFLGTLGGIGIAFFLSAIDQKVRTPQQLEDGTGLDIYASIPAFASVSRRHRPRGDTALVAADNTGSIITEAYRSLRANIRFTKQKTRIRTLAITSALPQEGKTTTTCNLGIVCAQAGSRTLIVDADLRRPSTHIHFGGERTPGLTDILQDGAAWRDLLSDTGVENLQVIHAGEPVSNPGALLDSREFQGLMEELREAYDYVLFDVPPVLAVADAAAFFRSLDGILLLNRYGRCSVDVVDGARQQIERLGGNLLGAVFNDFDASKPARRGYGYYGYQGHQGYYGEAEEPARKPREKPRAPRAKPPKAAT